MPPTPPSPTPLPCGYHQCMTINKIVLCAVLQFRMLLKNKDYCFQNLVLKEITQKGRGYAWFNTGTN